ncbi:hypothetical protein [Paralcaligenes ureilyticus]|nr:hypothetical protein [Paralcaligenes ureilyticus]
MYSKSADPMPATTVPTTSDMLRIWSADRCVQHSSARVYLLWIKWFRVYRVMGQTLPVSDSILYSLAIRLSTCVVMGVVSLT